LVAVPVKGTPRRAAAKATQPGEAATVDVGQRLRRLRSIHGYSLRKLAEKSGLAVNTLSLIENGRVSPSVGTLRRAAETLGVPITALFETESGSSDFVFGRSGRRPIAVFAHGSLEDLGAGMAARAIEPFLITLDPGADSGPRPIAHAGQEFVFCLEGQVEYVVAEQDYALEPGDSLLFDAHLPHRWRNPRSEASRAIMVLCPFEARPQPALHHFGSVEER
jgi:transcriptional regulator with XRE-family HTH domain